MECSCYKFLGSNNKAEPTTQINTQQTGISFRMAASGRASSLLSRIKKAVVLHPESVDPFPAAEYRFPSPGSQPERVYPPSFPLKAEPLAKSDFHYWERGYENDIKQTVFELPHFGEEPTPELLAKVPNAWRQHLINTWDKSEVPVVPPAFANRRYYSLAGDPDATAYRHDDD